ncbi:MAG: PDZ domain-containing protein [Flavobacteriales bacterium]|nr:PDZ domain-containing protein [Flavobacteriales bacterium]
MNTRSNTHAPRWRAIIAAVAIATGGAFTIAAGDSYFEISKNLEIFTDLYKELNIYYVDDTQPGKLMKTGIDAMLTSLDPYTQYIPESDMEDYRFQTTGQYGGIGALIKRKDDRILVSEPYENYPAMKAGMRAGDEIVEVDGRKVSGLNTDEVSKLLKGQSGTTVKILTKRDDAAMTHALTREEIKIPDVPYKGIIDAANQVGYIKLNAFTQTASSDVRSAMKELKRAADQGPHLQQQAEGDCGQILHPQRPLHPEARLRAPRQHGQGHRS